ncbi:MAG: hypothetical protein U9O94_02805 [Nanoarchaeota archaeon]|nr:hypothetical protein [Nanoarchaeota archaeon]
MQTIQHKGVSENSHGASLNKLAVTKKSYPIYFYISSTKAIATACPATKTDISLTIATGSGLVAGDYFRIGADLANLDDELLRLKCYTTGDTVMIAERAQLGTTATAHTSTDLAFKRQDGFTNTQLGAGTATIAESRIAIDLGDAVFYDLAIEVQCFCDQDYTSDSIAVNYAFSGFDDIPMGASTLEASLANTKRTLNCTYPNNTTLYYSTGNIKPTGRYLYMWVTGHADLDDAETTAKLRLNVV